MTSSLSTLVNNALPALSGSHVTYDRSKNMFVTSGYTSAMGHTYYQGVQISDRIAISYSIGRGGWGNNPLFLNAVTVYCFDGKEKRIIGSWYPTGYAFYNSCVAQHIAKLLLLDYLKSQMKLNGIQISDSELSDFASAQIQAAVSNAPSLIA